jgi:hypothetical protein
LVVAAVMLLPAVLSAQLQLAVTSIMQAALVALALDLALLVAVAAVEAVAHLVLVGLVNLMPQEVWADLQVPLAVPVVMVPAELDLTTGEAALEAYKVPVVLALVGYADFRIPKRSI